MPEEVVRKRRAKKETFMQGVITLIFSQVLIKMLGLVYTLYLTNREGFGDKGNGIVAAGYQIYAMLLTISSIGVPNAISKLVSERIAVGDHKGGHRIFKIAFATFAMIGLVGSLLLFFGAKTIAVRMATNSRSRNDISCIITSDFLCSHFICHEGIFQC